MRRPNEKEWLVFHKIENASYECLREGCWIFSSKCVRTESNHAVSEKAV